MLLLDHTLPLFLLPVFQNTNCLLNAAAVKKSWYTPSNKKSSRALVGRCGCGRVEPQRHGFSYEPFTFSSIHIHSLPILQPVTCHEGTSQRR